MRRRDDRLPRGRAGNSLGDYVRSSTAAGHLVVQPRMGFGRVERMRAGLQATRSVSGRRVGTITVDSYTRVGDHGAASAALRDGRDLNGFPLVVHGAHTARTMLDDLAGPGFPVQVRHGSPDPREIFGVLVDAGVDASEGGPVSYCLPYGRTPVRDSARNWALACEDYARLRDRGHEPHLESFGGCMIGQLCPPALLVAITILEGMFFRRHGIRDISLSYAQQGAAAQDVAALRALSSLATTYLSPSGWHVVAYSYMGVFPRTRAGARALLADSARLAVWGGAGRLIVKTVAEAHRIPTVAENVSALTTARSAAAGAGPVDPAVLDEPEYEAIRSEAERLVEAVLELDTDIGAALVRAIARGYIDVPFCVHPDNARLARSTLDERGYVRWTAVGRMPVERPASSDAPRLTADRLLACLHRTRRRYDGAELGPAGPSALGGVPADTSPSPSTTRPDPATPRT